MAKTVRITKTIDFGSNISSSDTISLTVNPPGTIDTSSVTVQQIEAGDLDVIVSDDVTQINATISSGTCNGATTTVNIIDNSTPEPTTPEPITPEPSTPEPSTPQPTPEPSTPEPITPEPTTPEPTTPEPSTPQPVEITPEPSTPEPITPQPTPEPTTPEPSTPEPSTPEPSTPQPTPEPTTPEPSTPEPITPEPTVAPTEQPCRSMGQTGYTFGYDAGDSAIACAETTTRTVYTTGDLPFTGVVLYNDILGCDPADPGYYSDGSSYFTVDQYGEITATTNCTAPPSPLPTIYEVGFIATNGSPVSGFACNETANNTLYSNKATFAEVGAGNNTVIYSTAEGDPFPGGNLWFGIAESSGEPTRTLLIGNDSGVNDDNVCTTPEPTTPTPVVPTGTCENIFVADTVDTTGKGIRISAPGDVSPTDLCLSSLLGVPCIIGGAAGTVYSVCTTLTPSWVSDCGGNATAEPIDVNLTGVTLLASGGSCEEGGDCIYECSPTPTPEPTTPVPTPAPVTTITITVSEESAQAACDGTGSTITSTAMTLNNGTTLCDTTSVTIPGAGASFWGGLPVPIWVKDGSQVREFTLNDGQGNATSAGACVLCSELQSTPAPVNPTPAPTTQCFAVSVIRERNSELICNGLGISDTGYFNASSVEGASVYYGTTDCSTPFAFSQYFAVGGNQYYQWVNGIMSGPYDCPAGPQ